MLIANEQPRSANSLIGASMRIMTGLIDAIKRDKSYIIGAIITGAALMVLFLQHDWQSKPSVVGSLDISSDLPDFASIADVKQKKQQFFDYLRPLVEKENGKIQYKKAHLERLIKELESESYHSSITRKKLRKIARDFGLKSGQIESDIDELRRRVDIIPSSLVLAQAANESAWGTSRFARQANNLFGQWCFTKGCGLVPQKRNSGGQHEVQKYKSIQASIASYMRNLNSHQTYSDLRNVRAGLRRRGQIITGVKLAHGLSGYSERGQDYVNEVISMIQQNQLE